jgi:hypothetical protein
VDLNKIKTAVEEKVDEIIKIATLQKPSNDWMQSGGKEGRHTENMGFILSEMQYMQRAYPNMEWSCDESVRFGGGFRQISLIQFFPLPYSVFYC